MSLPTPATPTTIPVPADITDVASGAIPVPSAVPALAASTIPAPGA